MSYMRVLPRDAFNEANFIKCIAKLTMDIEDGLLPFLTYEYDNEAFDLDQDINGCLYIKNMQFFYKGEEIYLLRPLNSREQWPLYIETDNDTFPVFDNEGNIIITKDSIAI